jgi:tRNA A58 N-methylase Trm61
MEIGYRLFSREGQKKIDDIYALQKLCSLSDVYLPWSESSLRPSAISTILNEVIVNNRKEIVEFGSGISTFFIAKILREYGGTLCSFEHDKNWLKIITDLLERHDLIQYASLNYAPLAKSRFGLKNCPWYDENVVDAKINNGIDMVIVDGPPAYLPELSLSRYPAVPFCKSRLSQNYCIVLDDIDRYGEKQILEMWERDLNIKFNRNDSLGGIAIGRSESGFTV